MVSPLPRGLQVSSEIVYTTSKQYMLYQCSQGCKLRPIIHVMLNLPCLCPEISKQALYNYLVFRGILRTYVRYSEHIVQFRQKLGKKWICLEVLGIYYACYAPGILRHPLYLLLPLVNAGYITIDTIVTIITIATSLYSILYLAAELVYNGNVLLLMYPLCY